MDGWRTWWMCLATVVLLGSGTVRAEDSPASIPLENEDYEAFVVAIDEAIADRDPKQFNAVIDWQTIVGRATALTGKVSPAAANVQKEFANGFLKTVDEQGVARQIIEVVAAGGTYKHLRTAEVGGKKRVVFRLLQGTGEGINYHFFTLARGKDGKPRADAMYVMLSGAEYAQTLRLFFLPALFIEAEAAVPEADKPFCRSIAKVKQINQLMAEGKFADAISVFDGLPPEVKKVMPVQLARMRAASEVNDAAFATAIEEFRKLFPKDPCTDFLLIDGYMLKKQYAKALASVDATEKIVGADPYLNVIRGNLYMAADDTEKADAVCKAAMKAEPSLMDAYWLRLSITLKAKNFDETLATLLALDKEFSPEFDDLTTLAEYVDFVKTPQFKKWKQHLQAKEAASKTAAPAGKGASDSKTKSADASAGKSAGKKQ